MAANVVAAQGSERSASTRYLIVGRGVILCQTLAWLSRTNEVMCSAFIEAAHIAMSITIRGIDRKLGTSTSSSFDDMETPLRTIGRRLAFPLAIGV